MALYTALNQAPGADTSNVCPGSGERSPVQAGRSLSGETDLSSEGTRTVAKGKFHGILYGFWPTLTYLMIMLSVLIGCNVRWANAGSLGFADLDKLAPVDSSPLLPGPGWLLAIRAISAVLCVGPCAIAVKGYRASRLAAGEALFLGGFEILLIFCTLWTWCCKAGYFILATCVSALYVGFDVVPPSFIGRLLWVWFDIAFGMSWLVFWVCWLFLLPAAWLHGRSTGDNGAAKELVSPFNLYMHNFNIVLVTVELILSKWTINMGHSIFPVYFGMAYTFFNWWLYSKIKVWIYFFLDWDMPGNILFGLASNAFTVGAFWSGGRLADALSKLG